MGLVLGTIVVILESRLSTEALNGLLKLLPAAVAIGRTPRVRLATFGL